MKKFSLIIISLLIFSFSETYSQGICFSDSCDGVTETIQITYSLFQEGCGLCNYIAGYTICTINGETTLFRIDSIRADNNNPQCCIATAATDPAIQQKIIQQAAIQLSLQGYVNPNDQYSVYTSSRCWQWDGIVGPEGWHNAVFRPCADVNSCCRYDYEVRDGVPYLINRVAINPVDCHNEGCFQLCE